MPPSYWDSIQEIFHKALALPESERNAFIAKACDGHPDLEREVRELLAALNSPGGVLGVPITRLDFVPDNLVGTTIGGRYRVNKELSCTAMSQVYLANDSRLPDTHVVIKVLSRVWVQDGDARQRFKREVEALSRIKHANVVNVSDTGQLADDRPYVVMSYIEGEALRTQIRTGGMDLERVASILKQIGPALDHCHEQKVVHRDLKPENIMMTRGTDSVVLIDFGIAKVRDSLVGPSTVNAASIGTLPYMSPEQLSGEEITAASDIYSLAVIAYEMVTGARPFNATSASQLVDMQRVGVKVKPRALRPNLPPRAQEIILRGLSFKREHRYQRASQFCSELASALKEGVTTEPAVTHWPKYLMIALGLAVISFGVYKYIIRDGKPSPNRSFSYFLTVQRMHDGQPYDEPYKSNGDETYNKGDQFQLTVTTPVPAFLYIFNERSPQTNDAGFTMIYPANSGSASVGANQPVQSKWFTFSGSEGAENFWLVWSTSPVSELDAAISEAAKRPDGALTGQTLVAVKQYLIARKAEIDATTNHYNANQTAVVRARRDLLVTLAQFKHR